MKNRLQLIIFTLAVLIPISIVIVCVMYKQSRYSLPAADKRPLVAHTPPMGWNGWNHFRCDPALNEESFKKMVDVVVESGMKDAGYTYVNLDDCWQVGRGNDGQIVVDQQRFPSGIKSLAEYVHSKNLLFGIYTSAGRTTCEGRPGSLGYERQDAQTYARWGVDYVKVDWCGIDYLDTETQYAIWNEAINTSGRNMFFNIAIAAIEKINHNDVWIWGHGMADSWRTARDLQDFWQDVLRVMDINSRYAAESRIGGWNDADMLQIGNGGMDLESYKSHFSMWAMMASPLIAGNDLRTMSPEIIDILTNRDIIALDQDPLGMQAVVADVQGEVQIWQKVLVYRGTRAVAVLNRSDVEQTATVYWQKFGLKPYVLYKDLWQKQASYTPSHTKLQLKLAPHQTIVLKVHGIDN